MADKDDQELTDFEAVEALQEAIVNPAPTALPVVNAPEGANELGGAALNEGRRSHANKIQRTKDALAQQAADGLTTTCYVPGAHEICRGAEDYVYVSINGLQVPIPIAERVELPNSVAEILTRSMDATDAYRKAEKVRSAAARASGAL